MRTEYENEKKENIEEQIHSMLEKVLIDDNHDDDVDSEQKTLYTMNTMTDMEDLFSFNEEYNQRKNRKAFSSISRIPFGQIMTQKLGNVIPAETNKSLMNYDWELQNHDMHRGGKKSKTHIYNQENPLMKSQFIQQNHWENDFIAQNQMYSYLNNCCYGNGMISNQNGCYNLSKADFSGFNFECRPTPSFRHPNENSLSGMAFNKQIISNYGNECIQNQKNLINFTQTPMNYSASPKNNIDASQEVEEFVELLMKNLDKIDEEVYRHMKGMFIMIISTQNGSRVLQKSLKKTNKEILSLILEEIIEKIQDLIVDPYANYFLQKFFGCLKVTDRMKFLVQISPYIVEISMNKIGTYPIQTFIEQLINKEEKMVVMDALRDHIYEMCFDSQGVHVVEKLIVCYEETSIQFIYDLIINNFLALANNCNGLCAAKKIIIHSMNELNILQIQKKIIDNFMNLVQNPFGNYVIQVAIDHWKLINIIPIIQLFHNKYGNLSMHKYSSNVIEKCLEKGGEIIVNDFIEEITCHHRVVDLMKNNYGNYVVQKALKLSNGNSKFKLVNSIMRNIDKIGDKKLIMKWKSIVEACLIQNVGKADLKSSNSNVQNFDNNFNLMKIEQMNNSGSYKSQVPDLNLYNNNISLQNTFLNSYKYINNSKMNLLPVNYNCSNKTNYQNFNNGDNYRNVETNIKLPKSEVMYEYSNNNFINSKMFIRNGNNYY